MVGLTSDPGERSSFSTIRRLKGGKRLLKTTRFDALEYIEKSFLDTPREKELEEKKVDDHAGPKRKFRKTEMSAPRPRRARVQQDVQPTIDPELQTVWQALPQNVEFLIKFYDDSVTANYYRGEFKETRQELIKRLLDPEVSLEETSRLLGVCPATVRRYTNRGWLKHHRTVGGQRRFRLSNIAEFVNEHGRFPEE